MQSELLSLGATHLVIGTSSVLKVVADNFIYSRSLKILSGAGTLEIVPTPVALTGSSCNSWGTGYPLGSGEVISIDGPAVFYLAATGATMTGAMALGYSAGASIL